MSKAEETQISLPSLNPEDSLDEQSSMKKEQPLKIQKPQKSSKVSTQISNKVPKLPLKSNDFSNKSSIGYANNATLNSNNSLNIGYKTSNSSFKTLSSKSSRNLGFINEKQLTPGPGMYQTMSCFNKEGKSYDFSKAPDRIPVNAYVSSQVLKVPAPGQYQIGNLKEKKGPEFTMAQKLKSPSAIGIEASRTNNPGPGQYENSQILSADGHYTLSTHKNTLAALISPRDTPKYVQFKNTNPAPNSYVTDNLKQKLSPSFSMSAKFKDPQGLGICPKEDIMNAPGPGDYENSEVFSSEGHYVLSTHKNTLGAVISSKETPKYVEFKNLNPGPGHYNKPINIMAEGQSRAQMFNTQRKGLKITQEADLSGNFCPILVPGPGCYQLPSDFDNKFEGLARKLKPNKDKKPHKAS